MLLIYYFSMLTFKISRPDMYVISSNIFVNGLECLYRSHTQQKHGGYYLTLCKNNVEEDRRWSAGGRSLHPLCDCREEEVGDTQCWRHGQHMWSAVCVGSISRIWRRHGAYS